MNESLADMKARLALAWSNSERVPVITRLLPPPEGTPPGFAAWQIGRGEPRSIAVIPELDDKAPFVAHVRMLGRAVAIGRGQCPWCFEISSLSEKHWMLSEERIIQTRHAASCPANFTMEEIRAWFPRAIELYPPRESEQ